MNLLNIIKEVLNKYNERNSQVNLASAAARLDIAELIAERLYSIPEISDISSDKTTTINKQQMEFFTNLDSTETK